MYLPSTQKTRLQHELPTLRQYKEIPVIPIEGCVNWCLRQWKEVIRRYTNWKSDGDRRDKCTYHRHQKTDCNTSRQPYANLKVSLSSSLNSASIDACARWNNWWEGRRIAKNDDDRRDKCTYHRHKKPDCNTSCQPYANTKRSLSSPSKDAWIDA